MPNVDVITMGCSKNLVDSERVLFRLKAAGFKVYHNPKRIHHDIAVVNTCGFINDAKAESIEMILYLVGLKEEGKLRKVFVMGCLSERFFKELNKELPGVDHYYGKFNWDKMADDILRENGVVPVEYRGFERVLTTPRHYAYIKISEGCDRHCAYCAIPLSTGRHVSRPMDEILDEVKMLVATGTTEFQVIAQELTYYGLDLYNERKIAELVEKMADIPGVKWIRLHYAYPNGFPHDLLRVMREKKNVCKYLDIALQHASDEMLGKMHRHITAKEQYELIEQIRKEVPGIALRTTFMVGYPGETEEDFAQLLEFVKFARFERMGAFTYSEEEGTFAAKNFPDDIPEEVKKERLDKLMALQQDISEEITVQKIGKVLPVMIDGKEGDCYVGRTEFDSPDVDGIVYVTVPEGGRLKKGHIYDVMINDADEFDLFGELVKNK